MRGDPELERKSSKEIGKNSMINLSPSENCTAAQFMNVIRVKFGL